MIALVREATGKLSYAVRDPNWLSAGAGWMGPYPTGMTKASARATLVSIIDPALGGRTGGADRHGAGARAQPRRTAQLDAPRLEPVALRQSASMCSRVT